ncbi:MAG: hypothetical protein ABF915_12795, partial [Schleiferilactobacillus harbinensis]
EHHHGKVGVTGSNPVNGLIRTLWEYDVIPTTKSRWDFFYTSIARSAFKRRTPMQKSICRQ